MPASKQEQRLSNSRHAEHPPTGLDQLSLHGIDPCPVKCQRARRVDFSVRILDDPLMASKTTVELVDDLDGKPAAETLAFGLDGVTYEIDLSEKNAKALRKAIDVYVTSARRVGGRKARTTSVVATGVDNRAVRAWASSNGITLSARGRIPADVVQQYRAAGN
jgi:hypothetical protein